MKKLLLAAIISLSSITTAALAEVKVGIILGFTGPIDGFRKNTTITLSPGYGSNKLKFQTIKSDLRKYWRFGRDYTIALRGFFGASLGKNKQKFFLGGVPYLIAGSGETNGVEDSGNFRDIFLDDENESLINDI